MASFGLPGQAAEAVDAVQLGEGLLQIVQMAGPADPVEDHPGQGQVRVEGGEAVHQGRGAPGHGPGVHHQQDRQPQPLGHLGGGAGLA